VTEREEAGLELILSEPDFIAWLEPDDDDADDDAPRSAA
jgi:hypothetical protein